MGKAIDLTGQRFGRLVVVSRAGNDKSGNYQWLCKCECGSETIVRGYSLRSGHTKSCGCLNRERSVDVHRSHGGRATRLYNVWCGIKSRCLNENIPNYCRYGGRGITVCDEWLNSFESFRDWALNSGYEDTLSIDRIDNNAGYEPSNCKWSTRAEQNRNQRSNINLTIGGVTKCLKDWAKVFHLKYGTLLARYHRGLRGIKLVRGGNCNE